MNKKRTDVFPVPHLINIPNGFDLFTKSFKPFCFLHFLLLLLL